MVEVAIWKKWGDIIQDDVELVARDRETVPKTGVPKPALSPGMFRKSGERPSGKSKAFLTEHSRWCVLGTIQISLRTEDVLCLVCPCGCLRV